MKAHQVAVLLIISIFVIFFILVGNEFKKDVKRFKERYDKAERYFGKSIIIDSDTLEIIDYRFGQFMLEDRSWISEDVVHRKITE